MTPNNRAKWHRLAPGVYDDNAGGLHLVISEMLEANGWPDTPENRETLERAARDVFAAAKIQVNEAD